MLTGERGEWKTVEEYLSDAVASDSEDQKRIKKANKYVLNNKKKAVDEALKKKRFRESRSVQPNARGRYAP